jgi:hypothetical protein
MRGYSNITEETKRRISESLKGSVPWNRGLTGIHSEESKKKISITHKGKKLSEEHKKKIGTGNKGKIVSEETKKKMSELHKGKKHTEETKEKLSNKRKRENNPNWRGGFSFRNEVSYDQFESVISAFNEIRRNEDNPNILEVKCTYCGKWYKPTWREARDRKKAIHYLGNGSSVFYCSKECKQECPTFARRLYPKSFKPSTSREVQPELRKLVFERDNWSCVKCEIGENLHCHHIDPVVNNPIESADLDNCLTLCKECHKEVHRKEGCKTSQLKC